mmetsp:Transcript_9459/g.21920  ORF Transcript_9459/g.21920 Transcript_9459/m.21920 type:complete len:211 (-) Transcript_9459:69-701(-)
MAVITTSPPGPEQSHDPHGPRFRERASGAAGWQGLCANWGASAWYVRAGGTWCGQDITGLHCTNRRDIVGHRRTMLYPVRRQRQRRIVPGVMWSCERDTCRYTARHSADHRRYRRPTEPGHVVVGGTSDGRPSAHRRPRPVSVPLPRLCWLQHPNRCVVHRTQRHHAAHSTTPVLLEHPRGTVNLPHHDYSTTQPAPDSDRRTCTIESEL